MNLKKLIGKKKVLIVLKSLMVLTLLIASVANASEVTGTLSSAGVSSVSTTTSGGSEVTGTFGGGASSGNGGTITGTVGGGSSSGGGGGGISNSEVSSGQAIGASTGGGTNGEISVGQAIDASIYPGFPDTGLPPEDKKAPSNITLAITLILSLATFATLIRKQRI